MSESRTFIFLADPQPNRADGADDDNPRVKALSQLNRCLNGLDSMEWPAGFGLSCEGQRIGPVSALVFGGDLCQAGGDYNFLDQISSIPPYYRGGWELEIVRHLFELPFKYDSSATRTKYAPAYFGLGNHDVQSDYTPPVGWYKGNLQFSKPSDYWRYQMWNFICQMHGGVETGPYKVDPVYPVTRIDSNGGGSFEWPEHSFNYKVDMGPFDLYQVHVYGGDGDYGRASGIGWLADRLAEQGPGRPVVIVQHYSFADTGGTPNWTPEQRDAFLTVLRPYNVVALLTGHNHSQLRPVPYQVPVPGSTRTFDEFRPGSCSDGQAFAVVRISDTSFDIMEGNTLSGGIGWTAGYSKVVPPGPRWVQNDVWGSNDYFGPLDGVYADTNEVVCPPGKFVRSIELYRKGNRVAPRIRCAHPDGSGSETVEVPDWNQHYFPGSNGLRDVYCDSNPVSCRPGELATGVRLYQKGNRLAIMVLSSKPDGSAWAWVENQEWNSSYFPGQGGLRSFYADTERVDLPAGASAVIGVALRQKGNRVAPRMLVQ